MYAYRFVSSLDYLLLAKVSAVAAFTLLLSSLLQPVYNVHGLSVPEQPVLPLDISIPQPAVCAVPTCLLYNNLSAPGRICSAAACAT
jgi:hypothetical protein